MGDEYFRVQIGVHQDTDTLALHPTPELHRRWQMFKLTDSYRCRWRKTSPS
jgi:hypothetical protein